MGQNWPIDQCALVYSRWDSTEMGYEERSKQLRLVAFSAVVLSTIAVTACMISFPMIFHYVQQLQAEIENDVSFCKSRSRDLWKEMVDIENGKDVDPSQLARALSQLKSADPSIQTHSLIKRQTYQSVECCTCHRGQPGPAGAPGSDGRDGVPGAMGRPGENGQPASSTLPPDVFPPQCPCEADPGQGGPQGPKGPNGNPGNDGAPGNPGRPGNQGPGGPKGPPGNPGGPGPKGPRGDNGNQSERAGGPGGAGQPGRPGQPGLPGKAGNPGQSGNPGPQGQPGTNGNRGGDGTNGQPGQPGNPGEDGPNGPCNHCPAARLAPGY